MIHIYEMLNIYIGTREWKKNNWKIAFPPLSFSFFLWIFVTLCCSFLRFFFIFVIFWSWWWWSSSFKYQVTCCFAAFCTWDIKQKIRLLNGNVFYSFGFLLELELWRIGIYVRIFGILIFFLVFLFFGSSVI